jgi:hypothetical protein
MSGSRKYSSIIRLWEYQTFSAGHRQNEKKLGWKMRKYTSWELGHDTDWLITDVMKIYEGNNKSLTWTQNYRLSNIRATNPAKNRTKQICSITLRLQTERQKRPRSPMYTVQKTVLDLLRSWNRKRHFCCCSFCWCWQNLNIPKQKLLRPWLSGGL